MTRLVTTLIVLLVAGLLSVPAGHAQSSFTTPGGSGVDGKVNMCINASGQAVTCSATTPLPVTPGSGVNPWPTLDSNSAAILSALQGPTPAGTSSIGNVGGNTTRVCVAPTVTNGTYSANNVVGGLLTFANLFNASGSGVIQTVELVFTTAQTVGFTLYPFNANPSNTTWTDHAAASINAADIFSVGTPIPLVSANSALGTMTVYSSTGIGQSYKTGGTSAWFILLPSATTASLGGTTNVVQVCVTVLKDS